MKFLVLYVKLPHYQELQNLVRRLVCVRVLHKNVPPTDFVRAMGRWTEVRMYNCLSSSTQETGKTHLS